MKAKLIRWFASSPETRALEITVAILDSILAENSKPLSI